MLKEIVATIEIPASLFLHMPKSSRQTAQLMVIAMESAALLPDNTTIRSPVMGCKISKCFVPKITNFTKLKHTRSLLLT
jgi:hypothetical protein